jgi:hypothetical protein
VSTPFYDNPASAALNRETKRVDIPTKDKNGVNFPEKGTIDSVGVPFAENTQQSNNSMTNIQTDAQKTSAANDKVIASPKKNSK